MVRIGSSRLAGLLLCATTWSAQAAATLPQLLLQKGLISEAEYRALPAGAAPAEAALAQLLLKKGLLTPDEVAALAPPPAPELPAPLTVATDDGFRFKAADGSSFNTGVLAQFDYGQIDDDQSDLANGSSVRRFRPYVAGTFLKDWQFRASYELAGGGSVIDAYVVYKALEPFTVTIGNVVQPFSFESVASDKTNLFVERALPFAFAINRAPGLAIGSAGARWSLHAGVFGEPLATPETGDEGYGAAIRATVAPVADNGRVLHLGFGLQGRWPSQDNGSTGLGSTLRLRAKPESDVSALRLVDTGEIGGGVRRTLALNPEFAAVYGPFSLQAEYLAVQVERARAADLAFNGWYVQTSVALTGESRPYRASKGVLDGIKPASPFAPGGGWGAWELAARLSELDLSDAGIRGGRERNATLGVNLYPNAMLRTTFNVVKVLEVEGGPRDGDEPTIYQLRVQLAY